MGWLALIQEIIGLPAQINAIWGRIIALESWISDYEKSKNSQAIDAAHKEIDQAQTSDELKKAAHDQALADGRI